MDTKHTLFVIGFEDAQQATTCAFTFSTSLFQPDEWKLVRFDLCDVNNRLVLPIKLPTNSQNALWQYYVCFVSLPTARDDNIAQVKTIFQMIKTADTKHGNQRSQGDFIDISADIANEFIASANPRKNKHIEARH
jgi:hypothetical protein